MVAGELTEVSSRPKASARDFLGIFENFVSTMNFKLYIESCSGRVVAARDRFIVSGYCRHCYLCRSMLNFRLKAVYA
jgi:hypothetical protein